MSLLLIICQSKMKWTDWMDYLFRLYTLRMLISQLEMLISQVLCLKLRSILLPYLVDNLSTSFLDASHEYGDCWITRRSWREAAVTPTMALSCEMQSALILWGSRIRKARHKSIPRHLPCVTSLRNCPLILSFLLLSSLLLSLPPSLNNLLLLLSAL